MKDYQFTSDSYRMFAAVTRMCHSPVQHYHENSSQKYMLRQIKSMDYALVSQEYRENHFKEKESYSYTAKDENGEQIINSDMDIILLMVYGHILYASQSYTHALSKFK